MGQNDYVVLLYRDGSKDSDDTRYYLKVERRIDHEDDDLFSKLDIVREFNDLHKNDEEFNEIVRVVGRYEGPQSKLLKIIKDILKKKD